MKKIVLVKIFRNLNFLAYFEYVMSEDTKLPIYIGKRFFPTCCRNAVVIDKQANFVYTESFSIRFFVIGAFLHILNISCERILNY
jgi:hypothetical protein